ncbi:hypothetical protein SLE2022_132210 [Rubroshorea leprosula]
MEKEQRRTMGRKERGGQLRGLHRRRDDGGTEEEVDDRGSSSTSSSPTAIHHKSYWTAIASPISPMT